MADATLDLDIDSDLAKLQGDIVAIAPVGSNLLYSLSSARRAYTKGQLKKDVELGS